MEHKVVKHIFVSNKGLNESGVFSFNFSEPMRNICAGRVSGVSIKTFTTINNSYVYFLRTDGLYGSRTLTFFNGLPDYISFSIPNEGTGTLSVSRFDDTGNFFSTNCHNIWGLQISLLDVNQNIVNPPDANWSFTVEFEFKINQ
jgi:hypothetical protein